MCRRTCTEVQTHARLTELTDVITGCATDVVTQHIHQSVVVPIIIDHDPSLMQPVQSLHMLDIIVA